MPGDAQKALRVIALLRRRASTPQVRFSIWSGDAAEAAVSLTEEEAARVAAFIEPPPLRRPLLDQLRDSLRL